MTKRAYNQMADKNRKKYMKRITITIKNGLTEKIIVYYNNFMSCNNIDKNIRQFNNTEESVEKEKRFQELFPTIKSPTEIECMEILNSMFT